MAHLKKFRPSKNINGKVTGIWIGVFAIIGISTLLLTKAATPGIAVTVDSSLPDPTNVKVYGDDQIAAVTWTPPANAAAKNIVGYYVTWGEQSAGKYTNAKQTTFSDTQIQPLTNGKVYNVKVQSVQGSIVQVPVTGAHDDANSTPDEARANGKVSPGATTTVTPVSTRVDQLRNQMTGFFDDFNMAAGGFNELKWNTAESQCVKAGAGGTFVNNQFHGHTQVRSDWCDRAQIINRPRAIFDISGKTESDPGVIAFDFDGVPHGRDAWYIDFIPANVRKNNAPLDITSHASVFEDAAADPTMLRLEQLHDKIQIVYYDANKNPHILPATFTCPQGSSPNSIFDACSKSNQPIVSGFSPLPEPVTTSNCYDWAPQCLNVISNFRRHWKMHLSSTKITVFLDGIKFWEGAMPSDFAQYKQFIVHNNLFSYNTGKGDDTGPTTSMIHWDNFGFNGKAPATVVHNYLDGGPNGTQPYLGVGTVANPMPNAPRLSKINIPDPIGSPVQARLMFTLQNIGWDSYKWSSGDHVIINGTRINFPNPALNQQAPVLGDSSGTFLGDATTPFADSIIFPANLLRQGMNDIQLNIGANVRFMALLNTHIELEYNKGTEPAYTQPQDVFGKNVFMAMYQPTLTSHDSYMFIEQDMGLPSGTIDSGSTTPPPTPTTDTTAPTVTITAPANNTSVAIGSPVTASADASDNIGVTKVEFYIGNSLKATDTSSPYSASLSTTGLSGGTYAVKATAYDAAGNMTSSASRSISIPSAPITPSPNDTSITPGSGTITDLSGKKWTVTSAGVVQIDGQNAGFTANVVRLVLHDGTIYQTNAAGGWWSWDGTSWIDAPGDPRPVFDTTNPSVVFNAPLPNSTISGSAYSVNVTALDAVGVTKVEFSVDGTLVSTDTVSPFAYTLDTTKLSNASHTILAKAHDAANNSGNASVTVTVNNAVAVSKCDFNADGKVSVQDLVVLINNYGKTVTTGTNGDCNKDGKSNIQDLVLLIGQYGL